MREEKSDFKQLNKTNMKTISFLLVLLVTCSVHAQQIDTLKYCIADNNIAAGGYDPVSYFTSEKPVLGDAQITMSYDGVTYRFSSADNKQKFAADPKRYLPQFGGWCSMTLAMGRATKPVYDNFLIYDGKLYLFERTLSVNGRELWLHDTKANEKTASKNYNSYRTTGKIK
jgi:YHS domain-containing protein